MLQCWVSKHKFYIGGLHCCHAAGSLTAAVGDAASDEVSRWFLFIAGCLGSLIAAVGDAVSDEVSRWFLFIAGCL